MATTQVQLAGVTAQLQGLVLQMQAINAQPTSATALTPATSISGSEGLSSLEDKVDAISSDVLSLQRDIAGIREALGGLRETMAVLNADLNRRNAEAHNKDAYQYNAKCLDAMKLLPLHDPTTHEPVPGLPVTFEDAQKMTDGELNQVIRALNADYFPNPTTTAHKRERLINVMKGNFSVRAAGDGDGALVSLS